MFVMVYEMIYSVLLTTSLPLFFFVGILQWREGCYTVERSYESERKQVIQRANSTELLRKIKTTNNQTNKQINGTNAVPHTNKE